jgi:hypothetical protein
MNKLIVKHGPASFALVAVLGLALSNHALMTMPAVITYVTFQIVWEAYRSRAKMEVPSTSAQLEEGIGITPRMIEAGALELANFDSRLTSFEDGALNIYRVMLRAKTAAHPLERRFFSSERRYVAYNYKPHVRSSEKQS